MGCLGRISTKFRGWGWRGRGSGGAGRRRLLSAVVGDAPPQEADLPITCEGTFISGSICRGIIKAPSMGALLYLSLYYNLPLSCSGLGMADDDQTLFTCVHVWVC